MRDIVARVRPNLNDGTKAPLLDRLTEAPLRATGAIPLDPVVRVRILAPQPSESPAQAGFSYAATPK